MSRIIYSLDEHRPWMTPQETDDLADTGAWTRYLRDQGGLSAGQEGSGLKFLALALIDLRPALEAKYTNVYEYNLGTARRVYSAAYKELIGAEPHFMTYVQLTPSMLGRLTVHVQRARTCQVASPSIMNRV